MATTKTELLNNGIVVATKLSAPFYSWDWVPSVTGAAVLTYKRYEDDVLVYTSGVINGTVNAAGGTYSAEATAVFANMATPPPTPYKDAMATLVDTLVTASLWDNIDEIQCSALDTQANGLRGWKGVANASIVGGVTHTPKVGLAHNGTDGYTNTGFIPATHGVSFTTSQAFIGRIFSSGTYTAEQTGTMGAFPSLTSGRSNLSWSNVTGNNYLSFRNNCTNPFTVTGKNSFSDGVLYMQHRNSVSSQFLYEAGVSIGGGDGGGSSLSDISLYEGAYNNAGTATGFHAITPFVRFFGGAALTSQQITDINTYFNTFKNAIAAI